MTATGICKRNGMWDTHTYYDTVSHSHLTYLCDDGRYVDIRLVECKDGRWFLIDDEGSVSDTGILDLYKDTFIEPRFFSSAEEATDYAIKAASKITGKSIIDLANHLKDEE